MFFLLLSTSLSARPASGNSFRHPRIAEIHSPLNPHPHFQQKILQTACPAQPAFKTKTAWKRCLPTACPPRAGRQECLRHQNFLYSGGADILVCLWLVRRSLPAAGKSWRKRKLDEVYLPQARICLFRRKPLGILSRTGKMPITLGGLRG